MTKRGGTRVGALAVLAAAAVLTAGCSAKGTDAKPGGPGQGTANPTTSPGAPATSGPLGPSGNPSSGPAPTWAATFAHVPDFTTIDGANVSALDAKALRALIGLDPHDVRISGKGKELADLGVRPIPSFLALDMELWRDAAGFLPFEPDRALSIEAPGKLAVSIHEGTFDVGKVTAAMRSSGGAVGPDATTETYAGESYLRAPGDELSVNAKAPKGLDTLRRPLRALVAADHVFISLTDEGMELAIDAWAGRKAAASDPDVASAAAALDRVGALTVERAGSGSGSGSGSGTTITTKKGTGSKGTTPAKGGTPASVLFVGASVSGSTAGCYLVATEASEAEAEQDVADITTLVQTGESEITGAPWSETFEIEDAKADGTVVVISLTTTKPSAITSSLFRRDNLTDL